MKGRIVLKKIILLVLCFIFVLSGCEKLEKAEPYYTETREDVVLSTQYEYYFSDEISVRCNWENKSSEEFSFYDTFELHMLGDDGEWYLVTKGDEIDFNSDYCHGIPSEEKSTARYDLSLYTDKLKEGEIYRISTYFFDENGNNYQAFAEFTCDSELAEKEMKKVSDGNADHRRNPQAGENFQILQKGD